jgi:RNA polymerase sigma-70 factor (ECF subfamily)
MPRESSNTSVTHSKRGTSDSVKADRNAQLLPSDGVQDDVGSIAMDRGLLAMAGEAQGVDSDAAVMLRVKQGDDAAFDFLVQKYRRAMLSFMFRMAHNAAAAEDLAQEVFLRVYRSRANYEPSAKFTTWLYRIATNLAVNHARDTRHDRPENMASLDQPDEESGQTLDVADESLTVEQKIIRQERMKAIRAKVQALPERQRMAVVMHKYQQMDYRQIADVLKLSESATKSLLFRAYETLRGQLAEFV